MSSQHQPTQQPILSRLSSSGKSLTQGLQRTNGALIVAVSVFVLMAGIGAGTSYLSDPSETPRSARAGSQDEVLARLEDYTRSVSTGPTSASEPKELLPDVNTMIERLAARLVTSPEDGKGWRTLGWSYFYTERYKDAVTAYEKAVALDPNSDELKLEYEEAKAKASESDVKTASPMPAEPSSKSVGGPSAEQVSAFQAMPPHDREAAIRSMVDGLAARLESSPHDVEGWTRLMRSRVVLGEAEVATTALRKALDVFKDDSAASAKIAAAATELGLKTQ